MNDLGERLKALRKRANLSQTALAVKIGVSYSQYGRYELKGVQPPANILNKLADILNTSVDYLINGDSDEKAKATIKNTELLQRFHELEALPEREQSILIEIISAYLRDFRTKKAYST